MVKIHNIELPDGTITPIRLWPSRGEGKVLIIWPGLGVPARYYDGLAQEFNKHGINVAIGELRGQGDSYPKPSRSSSYGYHHLASQDYPAVTTLVRKEFGEAKPYLLCHSSGGQIAALYAARARANLAGLILVASGSPHYRGRGESKSLLPWVGSKIMAATSTAVGYWPGDRVGGFGRQSKVLIADWARLAHSGRFEPTDADMNYEERVASLKIPVLAISMGNDSLAPSASVDALADKFMQANVRRWHQKQELGHNGWIRNSTSTVDEIMSWINAKV
ncbi:MAG: alpha/beta hydrolase family protein [Mycobacteriaceae bacterium]